MGLNNMEFNNIKYRKYLFAMRCLKRLDAMHFEEKIKRDIEDKLFDFVEDDTKTEYNFLDIEKFEG